MGNLKLIIGISSGLAIMPYN